MGSIKNTTVGARLWSMFVLLGAPWWSQLSATSGLKFVVALSVPRCTDTSLLLLTRAFDGAKKSQGVGRDKIPDRKIPRIGWEKSLE